LIHRVTFFYRLTMSRNYLINVVYVWSVCTGLLCVCRSYNEHIKIKNATHIHHKILLLVGFSGTLNVSDLVGIKKFDVGD